MLHAVRRRAIPALAASFLLIIPSVHAQDEVRAVRVVRTTPTLLTSLRAGVKAVRPAHRLADPAHGPGYVSQVGRATFTTSHH